MKCQRFGVNVCPTIAAVNNHATGHYGAQRVSMLELAGNGAPGNSACTSERIVGHSYKAQIDPAAPVPSYLARYGLRGDHDGAAFARFATLPPRRLRARVGRLRRAAGFSSMWSAPRVTPSRHVASYPRAGFRRWRFQAADASSILVKTDWFRLRRSQFRLTTGPLCNTTSRA